MKKAAQKSFFPVLAFVSGCVLHKFVYILEYTNNASGIAFYKRLFYLCQSLIVLAMFWRLLKAYQFASLFTVFM